MSNIVALLSSIRKFFSAIQAASRLLDIRYPSGDISIIVLIYARSKGPSAIKKYG
jgi:hypothetical protein